MSPVIPARRRAEVFDAAVEGAPTTPLDPATEQLLDLVSALRETPTPVARVAFVSDLRSQLMLAAQTELRPSPSTSAGADPHRPVARVGRSRRDRRVAVALGGLALVGATTTAAIAAQSALPGETLYPLKRAIENADTRLSSEDEKGSAMLGHASVRLSELDEMAGTSLGDSQSPVVESTLDSFSDQAGRASDRLIATYAETGDQAAIDELRVFAGESLSDLGRLESDLPSAVRPSVLRAAQTLFRIDAAADQACPACEAEGITQVPGGLLEATLAGAIPTASSVPTDSRQSGTSSRGDVAGSDQGVTATPSAQPTSRPTTSPTTRPTASRSPEATGRPSDDATPQPTKSPPRTPKSGTKKTNGQDPVDDLLDKVTGQSDGPTSVPTPSLPVPNLPVPNLPVPSDLGGILQGTVGGLNDTTDKLLP